MREFLTEVIYHIAKASIATWLYWYSLDRKVIYELAHNLPLQPTRYSARLSATLDVIDIEHDRMAVCFITTHGR